MRKQVRLRQFLPFFVLTAAGALWLTGFWSSTARPFVEVARQKKKKRVASSRTNGAEQLVIPSLEKVKAIVDERAGEIAYQAAGLKMSRTLDLE